MGNATGLAVHTKPTYKATPKTNPKIRWILEGLPGLRHCPHEEWTLPFWLCSQPATERACQLLPAPHDYSAGLITECILHLWVFGALHAVTHTGRTKEP